MAFHHHRLRRAFFVGMFAGGKSMAGLAIPGAIISGLGLMMFIQNLTGYWESWAYSWTIILVLVGLGIFIMGLYTEDMHRRQAGLRVMKVGAILFIIFGGFFELIFNAFRPYGIQQYPLPAPAGRAGRSTWWSSVPVCFPPGIRGPIIQPSIFLKKRNKEPPCETVHYSGRSS